MSDLQARDIQGRHKEQFAAVHGDQGQPYDLCEADCRGTVEEAMDLARAAHEVTGRAVRVVVVRELRLFGGA